MQLTHPIDGNIFDALTQRDCAFALYHSPEHASHQFIMQHDGKWQQYESILSLDEQAGFLMAPYLKDAPQNPASAGKICFWRDECASPPAAEQFKHRRPRALPPHENEGKSHYSKLFHRYQGALCAEEKGLKKLVLARFEDVKLPQNFSPTQAYMDVCAQNPSNFNALIHCPHTGTWLCSSPEILLAGKGKQWLSMALAGTQASGKNCIWTEKNRAEQAYVSQYLRNIFQQESIPYQEQEVISLQTGEIEHLCSHFSLEMESDQMRQVLAQLSPTPAISGYPAVLAYDFLKQHPDIQREYYTGYLGSYQPHKQSSFYVCLRCMQISGNQARLYAGGGIIPDSELESEWKETIVKMQSMRRLIEQN